MAAFGDHIVGNLFLFTIVYIDFPVCVLYLHS